MSTSHIMEEQRPLVGCNTATSATLHNNNPTKKGLTSEALAISFRDAYYSYGKKVPVLVSP